MNEKLLKEQELWLGKFKIEVLPPYEVMINDEARAQLTEIVQPHFNVFEYGSGKSTIWFAENCNSIVSVERNIGWYEAVWLKLYQMDLTAYLILRPFVDKERLATPKTIGVATIINAFPNEYFDLVFVDGAARPHCNRWARAKVKRGGWMVIDDLQFPYVKKSLHWMDDAGFTFEGKYCGIVHGAINGRPRINTTGFWRKMT